MILCLETATPSCSVALVHNGEVLACEEDPKGQNHSEKITLFIDSVMKKAGISYNQLDAVAVSMGPGSYTGLRIGVSTAKGICYAVSKPLIAQLLREQGVHGVSGKSERRDFDHRGAADQFLHRRHREIRV